MKSFPQEKAQPKVTGCAFNLGTIVISHNQIEIVSLKVESIPCNVD